MKHIGVVGAGIMGGGIAYLVASRIDAKVTLVDVNNDALGKAEKSIRVQLEKAVQKGKLEQSGADQIAARLNYSPNIDDIRSCSIVIEAVPEVLALKQQIFAELDTICPPEAILASNTSGLPITQIAAVTKHPERVIGAHFFNPAPVMKLVEIIRGYATSEDTITQLQQFCRDLGNETIVAKDYPGFITTRLGMSLMMEALRCLEEGVGTAEDIDKGCRLAFNHPVGPFQFLDLVGLDVAEKISEAFAAAYGDRFRPSQILKQLTAAGHLGRKVGRGFYQYD